MLKMMCKSFWCDEGGGFLNSAELIFLAAILVIGILPGVTALRDAIACEFADMAAAVNPPGSGNGDGECNGNGNCGGGGGNGPPGPVGNPNQITVCSDILNGPG